MNATTAAPVRATRAKKPASAPVADFSNLSNEQWTCRMHACEVLSLLTLLLSATVEGRRDPDAAVRNKALLTGVARELHACTSNPATPLAQYAAAARNSLSAMNTASDEWEHVGQQDDHDLIFGLYHGICAVLELVLGAAAPSPSATAAPATSPARNERTLGERKARWVFGTIASIAEGIERLCIQIVDSTTDDQEDMAISATTAEALANQIRLLTQIGQADVGDSMAEGVQPHLMLLPPAYHGEDAKEGGRE